MEIIAHLQKAPYREQSLRDHSLRVAERCALAGKSIGLSALGYLAGLMHDAGKAGNTFQVHIREEDGSQKKTVNHSSCGARYILEKWQAAGPVEGLTAAILAAVICGHHSGLPDMVAPSGKDVLTHRVFPEKDTGYEEAIGCFLTECIPDQDLDSLFRKAAGEVEQLLHRLKSACPAIGKRSNEHTQFVLGLAVRFLFSALVDADWQDTSEFFADLREPEYPGSKGFWSSLSEQLEQNLAFLPQSGALDPIRRRISDACREFARNGPGIYQLCVPTGGGKTLSALRFALQAAARSGAAHIYYVAPYKVILEQNAGVIRSNLEKNGRIGGYLPEEIVLEHHGDALREVGGDTGEELYRQLSERWTSPLILTTMVQFLRTLFDGSRICARRFRSLAGSVIILDEVQSIPPRFVSMLNAALNFLAGVAGCTVVLCTATQPELQNTPIPVMLGSPARMVPEELSGFAGFRRNRIIDHTTQPPLHAAELAGLAAEKMEMYGSVLVVMNTIKAARAAYEKARERLGKARVVFLSAGLCPAHRWRVLKNIRKRLDAKEDFICFSTQLIEAGVDISFNCAIRSLAGLDNVAQTAGRCCRNGGPALGEVLIIRSADERVEAMADIVKAQAAAETVLEEFRRNPERFADDLLSEEAIRRYYTCYYHTRQQELEYPVSAGSAPGVYRDATLFDLLSFNYPARQQQRYPLPDRLIYQAFETAGSLVQVIEEQGADVLVPFEKGKELIASFMAARDKNEMRRLFRQAQPYIVHVSAGDVRRLEEQEGALIKWGDGSIRILNERFYDRDVGVCTEARPMEPEFG